jgi:hypothetical protein
MISAFASKSRHLRINEYTPLVETCSSERRRRLAVPVTTRRSRRQPRRDTKWGEPCDLLCVRCRKNHDTRRGKLMDVRFRRDGRISAQPAICPVCGESVSARVSFECRG